MKIKINLNKQQLVNVFFHWLPLGGVIVIMSGMIYAAVQHNYRSSFNDPQIQIAEDIADGLSEGRALGQFNQQIDISKSLATFIIVYDDQGKPLASSAMLDSEVPVPPVGVFDYTRENGEDRITWEHRTGVRVAIVVKRFSGNAGAGFILVGRNMRELEKRTADLAIKIACGLIAALVVSFALDFIGDAWRRRAMAEALPVKKEHHAESEHHAEKEHHSEREHHSDSKTG